MGQRYNEDPRRAAFDEEVLRSLRAIPGVELAGLVSAMPLSGETWLDDVKRPDHPSPEPHIANYRWISPAYLSTLRIGLRRGRQFTQADRDAKVALISQRTAEQIWPGEDPLGRQFRREDTTYTVVGVVADTRSNSLKQAPGLLVYLPFWDNPPYATFFMLRTTMAPVSAGETIRRKIWSVDPEANLAHVLPMDAQVNESLGPERAQTFVLTSFGLAALLLAAAGIYGTLSYSVSARRQEIGLRFALGASKGDVYKLTALEAGRPMLLGLLGGVFGSLLVGSWVRSLLTGVQPFDAGVTAAVMVTFLMVGSVAAYLPSRRAALTDPASTLHSA